MHAAVDVVGREPGRVHLHATRGEPTRAWHAGARGAGGRHGMGAGSGARTVCEGDASECGGGGVDGVRARAAGVGSLAVTLALDLGAALGDLDAGAVSGRGMVGMEG